MEWSELRELTEKLSPAHRKALCQQNLRMLRAILGANAELTDLVLLYAAMVETSYPTIRYESLLEKVQKLTDSIEGARAAQETAITGKKK